MRSFYNLQCLTSKIYRFSHKSAARAKNHDKSPANAEIHGKRQNSRYPWIPWIRDLGLALLIINVTGRLTDGQFNVINTAW